MNSDLAGKKGTIPPSFLRRVLTALCMIFFYIGRLFSGGAFRRFVTSRFPARRCWMRRFSILLREFLSVCSDRCEAIYVAWTFRYNTHASPIRRLPRFSRTWAQIATVTRKLSYCEMDLASCVSNDAIDCGIACLRSYWDGGVFSPGIPGVPLPCV